MLRYQKQPAYGIIRRGRIHLMKRQFWKKTRERTGEKREGIHTKYRLAAAAFLLVLSAFLMILAAWNPEYAEWHSTYIYPVLVTVIGHISGVFPFSLAEFLLYLLLILFVITLARMIVRAARASSAGIIASWISGVLLAAGILAFLYTVCCGVNYHRKSFSEEEGIVTYDYTVEELQEVCFWLTDEVNALSGEVLRDEAGVMELDGPEGEGAADAMRTLAEEYSSLKGYYPQPKKLIVSEFLSYQSLTGIYSPFTVEANYNGDMTAYNIPFTTCHELSHLRGFMQEQEANFIAFLACAGSERTDFQYSGYLSAWVYCMNALYRADYESWAEVRVTLDEAVQPDLTANNEFWDSYEGTISETADKINDTYLKANGQADGVKSYDRMVDLIVAWFN